MEPVHHVIDQKGGFSIAQMKSRNGEGLAGRANIFI